VGTSTLLRNRNKLMRIQRKDKKNQTEFAVRKFKQVSDRMFSSHIKTIIIITLFTKSLETMTSMYSSKNNNNNRCDKTTTSRARYSRNDSSDDDNLHTDRYKQEN
jgi:hypothetical protein